MGILWAYYGHIIGIMGICICIIIYVCIYNKLWVICNVCMYVYIQYNHKYISCVCFLGTPGIRSLWGSLHPLWPLWRDDESYWMLQKKGSHRGTNWPWELNTRRFWVAMEKGFTNRWYCNLQTELSFLTISVGFCSLSFWGCCKS
jgi:hypothetical protein